MYIQLGNLSLHYSDQGSGIPLLLIHGFPLNRKLWEDQLSDLSDVARVIAPDLRGHGDSPATPASSPNQQVYSMDLLADDCIHLLDALNITQPVVVAGLSMGGYVSFALYRKYPQRVAGLVLAATRAAADTPEGKINREKAVEQALQGGAQAIAQSMIQRMLAPKAYENRPELIEAAMNIMHDVSVEGIVGDLYGMRDRPDSTASLSGISVPTLIIHGADDQIIPMREAQDMQKNIPGATLRVIPDAGHLVNLEQPQLFNQAVREFLTKGIK
jgi:3-oxoadipate enol-lactonase